MSKIKGVNTKPEIVVRKYLFSKGFRYRVNYSLLPGKPDIVLTKEKVAIHINGCFWHGHEGCDKFKIPKTRTEFWSNKIRTTISRDKNNLLSLERLGWKNLVVWECELEKRRDITLSKLCKEIKKRKKSLL